MVVVTPTAGANPAPTSLPIGKAGTSAAASPRALADRPCRADRRDDVLSPAARAIIGGAPFGRGDHVEMVDARYASASGAMNDVVVIRRYGHEDDAHRQSLTAIQARDLERMIADDEIVFLLGSNALDYNRARSWAAHPSEKVRDLHIPGARP